MLDEFRAVETAAATDGLSFGEAMRLLAGAPVSGDIVAAAAPDWSRVVAGPWLAKTLADLRDPALPGPTGSWRRAEGDVAPLSADRRAMAASALQPRPGRVPCR